MCEGDGRKNFIPSLLSPLVKVYHPPHANLNAVLVFYGLWRNLLFPNKHKNHRVLKELNQCGVPTQDFFGFFLLHEDFQLFYVFSTIL